jgi:hypothetical protein
MRLWWIFMPLLEPSMAASPAWRLVTPWPRSSMVLKKTWSLAPLMNRPEESLPL